MKIILGVKINKIKPVDLNDKRGPTYEWRKGRLGRQVSVYLRKKGNCFGEHYHKGDDPAKNPEYFFLVKGKIKFNAVNSAGQKMSRVISEGQELIIYPNVLHYSVTLTDVVFIEYRSTVFNKKRDDTYAKESYGK